MAIWLRLGLDSTFSPGGTDPSFDSKEVKKRGASVIIMAFSFFIFLNINNINKLFYV